MTPVSVSVIILASRPQSLRRCLQSLAQAERPGPSECLLVLNGNDSACAQTAADFSGLIDGLKILRDGPRSLGGARNWALRQARSRWLCFLDDDITVPAHYFTRLKKKIENHPKAAVIGGPNLTPPGSPLFERCIGHILGSALCAGPLARRCAGFARDTWTDDRGLILCNLNFDREILSKEQLCFDEGLARNEENLLLERLFARGRKALHAPELFVYHERRANLAAFGRQCFLSGQGRAAMSVKFPPALRPGYLAPALLALAPLAAFFDPRLFLSFAALYAAAAAANALFLVLKHSESIKALPWLIILFSAAQFSYGGGLLVGFSTSLVKILAGRETGAHEPRHART